MEDLCSSLLQPQPLISPVSLRHRRSFFFIIPSYKTTSFSPTIFSPHKIHAEHISISPMEKSVSSASEPVEFLFLHTIFNWIVLMTQKLSLGIKSSSLRPFTSPSMDRDQKPVLETANNQNKGWEKSLSREEMEMVMSRIGVGFAGEIARSDDISSLFAEKEPSLEEVKAAFSVFDENGDGFIDAEELQNVLVRLGFDEELEACARMISVYNGDGDGRIDFPGFVKLMEISLHC